MDSILESIKKLVGLDSDYKVFDADLIVHINTALGILYQLGVGPAGGFFICGEAETWDMLTDSNLLISLCKNYVYLKVRTLFDPPSSSSVLDSLQKCIAECEWRITEQVDEERVKMENCHPHHHRKHRRDVTDDEL